MAQQGSSAFLVARRQVCAELQLGISISTVERTWSFARAWLFREIQAGRDPSA